MLPAPPAPKKKKERLSGPRDQSEDSDIEAGSDKGEKSTRYEGIQITVENISKKMFHYIFFLTLFLTRLSTIWELKKTIMKQTKT